MQHLLLSLIVFLASVAASHSSQWVDPHSMKMDEKAKYNMKPVLKKTVSRPEGGLSRSQVSTDVPFNLSNSVLKRMLMILIKSACLDKNDPENYTGDIHFNISPKDYDFLNNVGEEDLLQPDQLRRIDTIFSESFRKSYINICLKEIQAGQKKLYQLVFNMQNMWILGAVCLIYCMYNLIKNDFSLAYIVKYLFILILIVDAGYRYNHLHNEAEEHNLGVVYSSKCDANRMSWIEWTKYMFSPRDCEKKTITPLDVLLHQLKNLITVPMEAIGTGMGTFANKMFTELPWGLNLVMWPIMLIFVLILSLFMMTIWSRKSIEFSLIPLKISASHPIESGNDNSKQSGARIPPAIQLNKLSLENNVKDESKSSETKEKETREMGTNTVYIKESKVDEGGDSFENANRFIEELNEDNTFNKANESHGDGILRQRVVPDKI
ncbi:chloride channel CLIC-like protein 1 isoform X3 [Euwallacea similis]|uniref:chloride channel CLIC-like protein 1 isoform X3 n=1 Tax=Euwallacea similis TaxID=1736056 RepID=UPI00344F2817